MKTTSIIPPAEQHSHVLAGIIARFAQIAIGFVVVAALLFLGAGRLDWMWAWVYLGISVAGVLINGTLMLRHDPTTIAERGRPGEMQQWDKTISGMWALAQYLALPLIAGLDARFGWSLFQAAWQWSAALVFALALAFSCWAMITNAYFSTVVRIQHERGQTVCREGPYHYVRHPGYAGFILQSLMLPLLLGSWWALIPGIASLILMVVRTVFEDRLLYAELEGYPDYVRAVRYRLIPGLW